MGRRVYQVSQVDLDPQDSQEDLVSLDPKVNQALLELDHQDYLERRYMTQHLKFLSLQNVQIKVHVQFYVSHRVNLASQGSREVQDLKELQGLLVFQVYQGGLVSKVTLAFQDSKVKVIFNFSGFRIDPQQSDLSISRWQRQVYLPYICSV